MEFEPRLTEHSRNVQVAGVFRGDYVKTFDRGNTQNTMEISRVAVHQDYFFAQRELLNFPVTIPRGEGTVTLTFSDGTGGDLTTYNWTNASVQSCPGRVRNNITIHTLTIVGGDIGP